MDIKGYLTNRGGVVRLHITDEGYKTNMFGVINEIINESDDRFSLLENIYVKGKLKLDYQNELQEVLSKRPFKLRASDKEQKFDTHTFIKEPVQNKTVNYEKVKKELKPKVQYTKEEIESMEETVRVYQEFCKDFEFEPSIRNVSTFAYKCQISLKEAQNYFVNYLRICGMNYEIALEKVKSDEFKSIVNSFNNIALSYNKINNRLVIYEGVPGTGKTTEAMSLTNGKCIICNSSMQPCDLIEDFKLIEGKGNLIPSPLRQAMEKGEWIVLDEINRLTSDCLFFLQGLTDNKESFLYKDETIYIHPNFKIIGTMNLKVGDTTYPLTPALADRCEEIKEFKLDAKKLVKLAFVNN